VLAGVSVVPQRFTSIDILVRILGMVRQETFQGSLPLLILKILVRRGPLHGYGITVRIQEVSEGVLRVEEGSLYPALHRMEEAGWIKAKWLTTENRRRARVYEITADGRKRLDVEEERWMAVNAAVVRFLKHA
jgi:PadR family transcriptional regulator, regulatory protein PadR